jgi:hypothetical protein
VTTWLCCPSGRRGHDGDPGPAQRGAPSHRRSAAPLGHGFPGIGRGGGGGACMADGGPRRGVMERLRGLPRQRAHGPVQRRALRRAAAKPRAHVQQRLGRPQLLRTTGPARAATGDRCVDPAPVGGAGVVAVAALVATRRGRWRSPLVFVGAATVVLAVPHALVSWHSDGMDTARHLMVPALQLYLGTLLMCTALSAAARARI